MSDLKEIAEKYTKDLWKDAEWLTKYAQDKKDTQRLIEITTTMLRARWLIEALVEEKDG